MWRKNNNKYIKRNDDLQKGKLKMIFLCAFGYTVMISQCDKQCSCIQ